MDECFTVPTTKYYANGRLKFESRHEGERVIVREWWPNGAKMRKCFRDRKTLRFVGMRTEYDQNGKLEIELPYNTDGNPHGVQRGYWPDGRVCYEMHYENGTLLRKVEYARDNVVD